jgi:hypothetical protein
MFFNEETERALMHRNTDRRVKHDNKPLIKSFTSPKIQMERKIGGSNHGVKSLTKSGAGKTNAKRQPTAWMVHLTNYYAQEKAKNPNYSYKQAMSDAKKSYTSSK